MLRKMDTAPQPSDTVSFSNPIPPSPWIPIPDKRIICIEHPAIIRNLQNGIETIGGVQALSKLAASNGNSGLHLRFRPEDTMQPPIESRTVPTNNILLKVTIPKRRKKRKIAKGNENGSTKPLNLQEKLKASKGKYKIEAVGMIERTVRFRDIANYQWNSSGSPFVAKMKETLLDCTYEGIMKFELSESKGQYDIETLPPPSFSNTAIPHTYNYRQNPAVKKALVDGKTALLNYQAGPKTYTPMVHISTAEIPTKPAELPQYEQLDKFTKECVDHVRALFEKRPIWTRRALYNHFPRHLQALVRFSMAHVAYMWRAGPWRDTCVSYGVDPRADPAYRKYQSVFFQMDTYKKSQDDNANDTHIFDGKRITRDGRCYQLCDVTDNLVKQLINTEDIRAKFDSQDGWYRSSTMSKIKALMKAKIKALGEGNLLPESEYVSILEQPSEDEEQEAIRKEKEAMYKNSRSERRRQGLRAKRHSLYQENEVSAGGGIQDTEKEDAEEEDVEEDADDGEWEKELKLPSLEGPVDGRVQKLMAEYEGDLGYDLDDEEGDFDLLGGDDDDEEQEEEDDD